MIRILNFALIAMLVASAIAVYSIKYESTIQVEKMAKMMRAIEREKTAIDALRSEYASLVQPERLEGLAKAHLEMAPMRITQVVHLQDLPEKPPAGDPIADKLLGLGLGADPLVTGSTP